MRDTREGIGMTNDTAIGRNFEIRPDYVDVFGSRARRLVDGDWEVNAKSPNRFSRLLVNDIRDDLRTLLDKAVESGEIHRVEMIMISPWVTVFMCLEGLITPRHFGSIVNERSCYFDISGVQLGTYSFPLRIAQIPRYDLETVNRFGHPL